MEQIQFDESAGNNSRHSRKQWFVVQFATTNGAPQIVLLMLIVAMGWGSIIVAVPPVMTDRFARLEYNYSDDRDCGEYKFHNKPQACVDGSANAQNAAAVSEFLKNFLQFATSAFIGTLSDQYGRRSFILLGVFVSSLLPICLVMVQLIPQMSPLWYYSFNAFTGLFNWITIALSSLSDVMPPQWRAAGFGIVLAGLSLGFACSPQLSLGMGHFGVSVFSVSLMFLGWIATFFFLPETLSQEANIEAVLRRDEELQGLSAYDRALYYLWRPLREISILNRNYFFRVLSLLAFFSGVVVSADQTLLIYYLEERLDFVDKDVAKFFLINGIFGIAVQVFVLKPLNGCVGEKVVIIIAFLCGALHNGLYGIATNKTTAFIAVAISSLSGMAFPTISAIKANNVDQSEQGRIQGALYSVQALASACGPVLLQFVYIKTKDSTFPGPGGMFLCASGLFLIAMLCAFVLPNDRANSVRAISIDSTHLVENDESLTECLAESVSESISETVEEVENDVVL